MKNCLKSTESTICFFSVIIMKLEKKPYHLDFENVLDLTKKENLDVINRDFWTEEKIQEEINKIKKFREKFIEFEKKTKCGFKKRSICFS